MLHLIPCGKCNQTKPVGYFYKSTIRKDRSKGECKICVRARVKISNKKPHRVAYFNSYQYSESSRKNFQRYLTKYPHLHAVRVATNQALRTGLITKPLYCEYCNKKGEVEAHHDDYNDTLNVKWLCRDCHSHWHNHNTPIYIVH